MLSRRDSLVNNNTQRREAQTTKHCMQLIQQHTTERSTNHRTLQATDTTTHNGEAQTTEHYKQLMNTYQCHNETCPRGRRPCCLTTPSACRRSCEMDSREGSLSDDTHVNTTTVNLLIMTKNLLQQCQVYYISTCFMFVSIVSKPTTLSQSVLRLHYRCFKCLQWLISTPSYNAYPSMFLLLQVHGWLHKHSLLVAHCLERRTSNEEFNHVLVC